MDPVTRRRIWNVIENAKQGRSIILTTHSMVEADVLSDCIGIMAKGMLHCIGTSIVLKSRFGSGYTAKVTFPKSLYNILSQENDINAKHREAVKLFFNQVCFLDNKIVNVSPHINKFLFNIFHVYHYSDSMLNQKWKTNTC